jgi:hypothetical protein
VGDRLVILVAEPAPGPEATVTIENKVGGDVVWTTPQNANKILAKVKQPLKGVGRYKGTERAGAGAIVSWAPSVVLVSTTGPLRRMGPNGEPGEDRGGFVIQPAEPTLHGTTHPASQLLLEALPEGDARPEVSPFFGLSVPVSNGDPLDLKPTRIEVRIDGGNWEPFPDLRGTIDGEALTKAMQDALGGRNIKEGITHLRIVFGTATDAGFRRRFKLATTAASEKVQRGEVTISANVMGEGVSFVQFFLDGVLVQVTNQPPFNWKWNTLRAANGEHLLEIRGLDANLSAVTTVTTKVMVDN